MKLSIVIVSYKGWNDLRVCLDSLTCLKSASFTSEVIVVDNCSDDGELPQFIKDFPDFRFIESPGNFGFAYGCNLGASHSTGEYIFFLNPDTIVSLEAVGKLLQCADDNPALSILSCGQQNEKGKKNNPIGRFIKLGTLTSLLRVVYRSTHPRFRSEKLKGGYMALFPDWVSGSAILMKHEAFLDIGGWSEDFWMYFEDMDLCKRVTDNQGVVAYIPDITITHLHGGSSRINVEVEALTRSEVIISKHIYVHRHFAGIERSLMQTILVLNNIFLEPFLSACIGMLVYFSPKYRVYYKRYLNLVSYYFAALKKGTWKSNRSAKSLRLGLTNNRVKISATIITFNEEKKLEPCLKSLLGVADEIVVVDSCSTDRTEEICSRYPVKFIKQPFLGYVAQKNFAMQQATHDFILSLDADERLSDELRESILVTKAHWGNVDGYIIARRNNYCGRWMQHSGWYERKIRLWDRRRANWSGVDPHDSVHIPAHRLKKIAGEILHYPYLTVDEHIQQIHRFAEIAALAKYENGERPSFILNVIGSPLLRFVRSYFLQFGFLDGYYGFVYCSLVSCMTLLKYIRLYEYCRRGLPERLGEN